MKKSILIVLDENNRSQLSTEGLSKYEIIGLLDTHLSFFKDVVKKSAIQQTDLPENKKK